MSDEIADQKKLSEKDARILALREKVKDFPQSSGIYLMKNEKGTVIYVGKAINLKNRVRSYFNKSSEQSVKTSYLVGRIHHIDYILTDTEVEAFLLEASMIKKYKPRYNVRLKDDRAYPYIKCTMKHDFPKFEMCRKVIHDGALYFGPYTSGFAVRETIDFMNKTFQVRDCKDSDMKGRKRPCLTYEIGRCKAPCVGFVDQAEYALGLEEALKFLRGESETTVKVLKQKMKAAALEQRFEAAARFRDAMQSVQKIWEKQSVINANDSADRDAFVFVGDHRGTLIESVHARSGRIIGNRYHFIPRLDVDSPTEEIKEWLTSYLNQYYAENFIPDEILLTVDLGRDILSLLSKVFEELQNKRPKITHIPSGQKSSLVSIAYKNATSHFQAQVARQQNTVAGLEEIKKRFGLERTPVRIECFDISNIQGEQIVASQVVYEDGVPKKSDYRRYKVRTVEDGPNDYASMKEVLSRRFEHKEYDDPDLIVIDGGKGQLRMGVEVLKEIKRPDIPIVGLAKARTKGSFKQSDIEQTEERFFLPGRQNYLTFRPHSEAFRILVSLRDEAHRFAISFHRKLRGQASLQSELDRIKGLGPKRKKTLLSAYASVADIKKARAEDLAGLPGISLSLAQSILDELSKELN